MPEIDPEWRTFDDAQMRQLKRSLAQKATREGKPPGAYWDRIRNDLEIDRNLRELAAAGIAVTYHSCDVTDWAQLDRTLRAIRQSDGPIEGIVHRRWHPAAPARPWSNATRKPWPNWST